MNRRRVYPVRQILTLPHARQAKIYCDSNTKVVWTKNGKTIHDIRIQYDEYSITISDIKIQDSGYYRCHGFSGTGEVFEGVSELIVGG